MRKKQKMQEINMRNYAHLGDAVWELYVREHVVDMCLNPKELHRITTSKVNSKYQSEMLNLIDSDLTEKEEEIKRRARNMEVPVGRRNNQSEYRQATAFEALIGYWYREDRERLNSILYKLLKEILN